LSVLFTIERFSFVRARNHSHYVERNIIFHDPLQDLRALSVLKNSSF
jgi:hypothetical protein